jgi:Domain of unknown function (DUF4202)
MSLLENALEAFDEINSQDPRRQSYQNRNHPREWIFSVRVSDWIERLDSNAPEAVRLAARAHTLRRWEIPRDRYAMDNDGYHEWRRATALHSARAAGEILRRIGYWDDVIDRVRGLILRETVPDDPDARLLEDADCLAFLEMKLQDYLPRWDEKKLGRILQGTWAKMSPAARQLALELPIPGFVKKIIDDFKGLR